VKEADFLYTGILLITIPDNICCFWEWFRGGIII